MTSRIIKHEGDIIVISKSNRPIKKYMAVIEMTDNNGNKKIKTVHFGGIKKDGTPYEQYKDSTGLGLYSKYDHLDKARRDRYYKRHGWYSIPYTADWFSKKFLW